MTDPATADLRYTFLDFTELLEMITTSVTPKVLFIHAVTLTAKLPLPNFWFIIQLLPAIFTVFNDKLEVVGFLIYNVEPIKLSISNELEFCELCSTPDNVVL